MQIMMSLKSLPKNKREGYEQGLKKFAAHVNKSNVVTRTIALLDC